MPVNRRATETLKSFDLGLSYKTDAKGKFKDIRNAFFNRGKLETRHGYSRYNDTSVGGKILSMSYFKDNSDTIKVLAKYDTDLYTVPTSGAASSIKSSLTATTKHRGLTLNNRHFIAIENDGIFVYDGSNFDSLGNAVPGAPSVAASGAGNDLATGDYTVALTFYSSTTGYETNQGVASAVVTVGAGQQIDITSIPTTATNSTIDKVRIYLRDDDANGAYLFDQEISLGTSTATIADDPTSTRNPPTNNAQPISGGAKYLTSYNRKLVYSGNNTFKSDVFFSETDLPEAFSDQDDRLIIAAEGQGPVTGLATGFFNDSNLDPYLCIFKKNAIQIFSEVGGVAKLVTISDKVGCVSHDTIVVRNGDVYFLSESGWRVISNGRLLKESGGKTFTLGGGDLDDIFASEGFIYQTNNAQLPNTFGVYYSVLDQYITWVPEGSSTSFTKQYAYEFNKNGFTAYQFEVAGTAATVAEDANGNEIVLFGDNDGWLYKHSIKEDRTDVDSSNSNVNVDFFALVAWFDGTEDFDATYSFRELIVTAVNNTNDITVRAFVNYDESSEKLVTYSFPSGTSGFILDESKLDEGIFGDDRQLVRTTGDINRTGYNILIGFYQNATNSNVALVNAQLHYNKNGNRSLP